MLKTLERIADRVSIQELAAHVGAEAAPEVELEITGVAPIDAAGPTELSFVGSPAYAPRAASSRAGALLVGPGFEAEAPMPLLRVRDPRYAYARALELFFARARHEPGVHPTAIVPDSCTVGDNVSIGAYVVLGENVVIGAGTVLHPHAVVYDDALIGADCEIHSGAVIRERVRIGDRVIVQNGAVVGAEGFGYLPMSDRSWQKVPQAGDVELGDDVEVQASTCIDRAAVGTTAVGRGSKLDNLVQIGHGSRIGEDSLLCGQVGLAGSTSIGSRVVIGGQVGVAGHLTIADDISIAGQAGVMHDLEGGKSYMGVPAVESRHGRAVYIVFTKLPQLAKRVKALERANEKR